VKRLLVMAMGLAWPFLGIVGCSSGRYEPLTAAAADETWTPKHVEEIVVEARSIDHPALRPLRIDLNDGLSPDEAAVIAVLANPGLRAVREERGVAEAQIIAVGLLPNPTLALGMDVPVESPGKSIGYNAGVEWEISALVPRESKIDAASRQAAAVDLDIAWQEWQTAESAKIAVLRLAALERERAQADALNRLLEQNLATVSEAAREGQVTEIERAAAEAAHEESRSKVLELDREVAKRSLELKRLLGMPADREIRLEENILLPECLHAPTPADLTEKLEHRRLDLLALRKGYESGTAAVRAAVLSQFPRIAIGVGQSRDTDSIYTVGPSLSIELPVLDHRQADVALENASQKRLLAEYASRVFEAENDIAMLLADIQAVDRELAAAQSAVPILEHLAQTVQAASAEGNVDILSYYNAVNNLSQKRIEIIGLEAQLAELGIGLEIAAGRDLPELRGVAGVCAAPPENRP